MAVKPQKQFGFFHRLYAGDEVSAARSYETADPAQPLRISSSIFDLLYDKKASRLIVGVTGALHPYDPHRSLGMIGDDAKNPALFPVIRMLKRDLPPVLAAAMVHTGVKPVQSQIINSTDGFSICADFSTTLSRVAKPRLMNAVAFGIDELQPATKRLIAENKILQPPADRALAMQYQAEGGIRRMMALAGAGILVAVPEQDAQDYARLAENQGMRARLMKHGQSVFLTKKL